MIVFSDRLTRVQLEEAADFLNHQCPFVNAVELVIQLGSGLTAEGLFDEIWSRFPLQHMPHMPSEDSLAQHQLEVIWGMVGQTRTLAYSGRFHLYENYGRLPCLLPIWVAGYCGARTFILTNAAGAVSPKLQPGTLMCISDHINNLGCSALSGHQHLVTDPYVDMSAVYKPELWQSFRNYAADAGVDMQSGVYLANHGPQFETPAEVRMAQVLGADAVGMSTVLEASVAHALGAQVLGLSLITNPAAGLTSEPLQHEDHLQMGQIASKKIIALIRRWLHQEAEQLL